jgi:hypothetical protein
VSLRPLASQTRAVTSSFSCSPFSSGLHLLSGWPSSSSPHFHDGPYFYCVCSFVRNPFWGCNVSYLCSPTWRGRRATLVAYAGHTFVGSDRGLSVGLPIGFPPRFASFSLLLCVIPSLLLALKLQAVPLRAGDGHPSTLPHRLALHPEVFALVVRLTQGWLVGLLLAPNSRSDVTPTLKAA